MNKAVQKAIDELQKSAISVNEGRYEEWLRMLMEMGEEELRSKYQERETEPPMVGEDWVPVNAEYL